MKNFNLVEVVNVPAMVKEWGNVEHAKIDKALKSLFIGKRLTDHRGNSKTMYTMNDIEYFFGLPYTSSSSFAMLGNTNTNFYFDDENEYNFDCVGLGEDGNVYLFCINNNEDEKVYRVE